MTFSGSGIWNEIANYTFTAVANDGSTDSYTIVIMDPFGSIQYSVTGDTLRRGGDALQATDFR